MCFLCHGRFTIVRDWLPKALKILESFRPSDDSPMATIEERQASHASIRLKHARRLVPGYTWMHNGLLSFPGGQWVYLITLSSHGGYDITLAIDQDSRVFKSYAHICPVLGLAYTYDLCQPFRVIGRPGDTTDHFRRPVT